MKLKPVCINDKYDQWVTYTVPKSARLSDIHDALQDDESAEFETFAILFSGNHGEYEDPEDEFHVYNISNIWREVIDSCGGLKHFLKNNIPRSELLQTLREMGIDAKENEE